MKIVFVKYIITLCCICFISCENSEAAVNDNRLNKEEVSQIVKEKTDSLFSKFKEETIEIESRIKSLEESTEKINENSKEKGVNHVKILYLICLVIFGIIAWLIHCWNKALDDNDRNDIENDIGKLEKKIDVYARRQQDNVRKDNTLINNCESINLRINDILVRLTQIETSMKATNAPKEEKRISVKSSETKGRPIKEGYFGMVKGKGIGIFNDEFNSKGDKCKFKVYYSSNGNEAEFELIDLNRIRSLDGIEKAIEFDASQVSLEDASDYDMLNKGLVRKNGEIWEIVRKVEIVLKK